jgi:hypothetical protein
MRSALTHDTKQQQDREGLGSNPNTPLSFDTIISPQRRVTDNREIGVTRLIADRLSGKGYLFTLCLITINAGAVPTNNLLSPPWLPDCWELSSCDTARGSMKVSKGAGRVVSCRLKWRLRMIGIAGWD